MKSAPSFRNPSRASGFTLVELLVAMAITVVLIGILVYLTSISMDTYRDSRNEVRAARQARAALETIAKDFESMVFRRDGNNYEWLFAQTETSDLDGPAGKKIPNSSRIIFFTGATDRYGGDIGGTNDNGGDVSAVSYRLVYKDQISGGSATTQGSYPVFSMYRHLVNPDNAFALLAADDLNAKSGSVFSNSSDLQAANFLVENIYEFTVTFLVEVTIPSSVGAAQNYIVRATMKPDGMTRFVVRGDKLDYDGSVELPTGVNAAAFASGSIVGVETSITVLTDRGLTLAQRSGISREDLIKKHSYQYTKTITTPRP